MCSSSSNSNNKTTPSMNRKRRLKARKSRTKAKKPKFLSLRLQFPVEEAVKARRIGETRTAGASAASVEVVTTSPAADSKSHGLNLFPLHPDNQVLQDRESTQDQENVAYFFSATDGGATTLTGLLDDDSANAPSISSHTTDNNSNSFRRDDLSPSSASLTYTYGGHENRDGSALVRNAMKNRERDSSEEKWVHYSEVVERRKIKEEEVTSSALDPRLSDDRAAIQGLSLKLDYQEILKAWSNKGPLYVDAENSQIVPDMSDDFLLQESSYNAVMGWGCKEAVTMGLMWRVPEIIMGQREASVLRYKEKRRNRLFSNKIRYQVRKLNAEKRPRLKGRFVKRS